MLFKTSNLTGKDLGRVRVVKRFAWYPINLSMPENTTVWLQNYYELQRVTVYGYYYWYVHSRYLNLEDAKRVSEKLDTGKPMKRYSTC